MEVEALETLSKVTEGNALLETVTYLGSIGIAFGIASMTVLKLFGKRREEPELITHQLILDRIESFEVQMKESNKEFRSELREEIRDWKHN